MVFEDAIFVLFFRRKEPKELEWDVVIRCAAGKFRSSLFKGLSRADGETSVARRNERNTLFGVFFLVAFSFAPFESKEKADNK